MKRSKNSKGAFALGCVALLAIAAQAEARWYPFRLAGWDIYTEEKAWESVSSIYGLRVGLATSVNKNVYGISLSPVFDGGEIYPESSKTKTYIDENFGGIKIGGVGNVASGSGWGLQLAGLRTYTGVEMRGLQLAGLVSKTSFMNGIQVGGLVGEATDELSGFQLAALYAGAGTENDGSSSGGLQIGGVVAQAGGLFSGIQIGCLAIADEFSGVQIGVVNYARVLHGIQIGAINVSGSASDKTLSGFPVIHAIF